MNKTLFIFSFLLTILLILASCKTEEDILQEKKECYEKCMDETDDKTFCLEDCRLEKEDLEEKAVCGDSICQDEEKQESCPEDCLPKCSTDSDCPEKYHCENSMCKVVACTTEAHCQENETCKEYVCVEEAEESILDAIQKTIDDLDEAIDVILDAIDALQPSLDAADASAEDKETVQEDTDALDDVVSQLEIYKAVLKDYKTTWKTTIAQDDADVLRVVVNVSQKEIEAYLEEQSAVIDRIEKAIADLEPAAKPDLLIDDIDIESVDGDDATFSITYKNVGEGNTSTISFRIKLTSFDKNEKQYDTTKTTITSMLKVNEEKTIDLEIELPYDVEQYFTNNPTEGELNLTFSGEIDIDNTMTEEDEGNNQKNVTLKFDREDYVTNLAPTAVIAANATSVFVDEIITFLGTGSSDSDGSIVSYNWTFGETLVVETGATQIHAYDIAGTYTVTLIVTDNEGATDTDTVAITVS